jgi:hypothetical protein
MLRAAALSLLVLVSVIVMLPMDDSSAHHNGRSSISRRSRMNRRHSRVWWRRYRARMRRKRAAALRHQQALLRARSGRNLNAMAESHKSVPLPGKLSSVSIFKNPSSGWNPALPNGWSRRGSVAGGEMKFVVSAQDGRYVGEARLSLVNAHAPVDAVMAPTRSQRKMLGGVSFTELRRTVIDKMLAANGWVVNDLTREIGGRPVFIVLAQTTASSDGRTPRQLWVFYFTEVEGRIYSLAINSLPEFADRITDEAAQLMASFHANTRSMPLETSQR